MAEQEDVRAIAMALPGVNESSDRFAFSVPGKKGPRGFLWTWAERIHPKKPKAINEGVIAVVVPNQLAKEILLGSNPEIYFTEPHYDGFLAVLVNLDAIPIDELEPLIVDAWRCKATPDAVALYDSSR